MSTTLHHIHQVVEELDRFRDLGSPTPCDAHDLYARISDATAASFFFREDFADASWLALLAEVGAFQKYSRARAGKHRRWVIFRELAAYLHRVAKAEPQQVADILASLRTKDSWATGQLMKATLALPDECAAKVVPQLIKWCEQNNPFARAEDVIELARRMLRLDRPHEFRLLLGLLLKSVPKTHGHSIGGILFDNDLTKFVRDRDGYSAFCQSAPFDCLDIAEDALRQAIKLKAKAPDPFSSLRSKKRRDPSSGMRSAIEEHEQNRYPDFEDGLVVAVRDALAASVKQAPAKAVEVVQRYLHDKWSLFRRLAIYILSESADTFPELARSAAASRRFFKDVSVYHEYWHLVPAVFNNLSPDSQKRLLKWINAAYPGADDMQKQCFMYRRLTMLAECDLPYLWHHRLQKLQEQLPESEHPDFLIYAGPTEHVRPESPISLKGKSTDEIYEFLGTWRSDVDKLSPFAPSYQGFGEELMRFTQSEPNKYIPLVHKMGDSITGRMADEKERHWAIYIGCMLTGYREACREGKSFDWSALLDFIDKLVPTEAQPSDWPDALPDPGKDQDWDYGWRGVRHDLVNLLTEGIDAEGDGRISDSELPRVRDILIRLTKDPFPTLEYEHEYKQKAADTARTAPVDWYHVAINTNRPEAANALLRYALRHGNRVLKEELEGPRVQVEVREALSRLAGDPCRSVHAMLGSWLGFLSWLDRDWLKDLLNCLLPMSQDQHDVWEAAWVAFLQFGRLNSGLHSHLMPHYQMSISQCIHRNEDDPHLKGLCKHLAAIYTWGWEDSSGEESLIFRFYAVAGDDAASELAQAFGLFAGNLNQAGDDAPSYWQRIEILVRRRIKQIYPQACDHIKELQALATWLDAWVERGAGDLKAMSEVLEVMASVPLHHLQFERVIEPLVAQARTYPGIAARLLRQMLSKCERDAWFWERGKIDLVLESVFASHDSDANRDAIKIIEFLWEQGEWQTFEKLGKP